MSGTVPVSVGWAEEDATSVNVERRTVTYREEVVEKHLLLAQPRKREIGWEMSYCSMHPRIAANHIASMCSSSSLTKTAWFCQTGFQ
jgi:hypothetical protein